jgi:murein DD-endopeptidase MepM/ murein hydrolase activator NlpD
MKRSAVIMICLVCSSLQLAAQEKVVIQARPGMTYIEQGENKQVVNFDFVISHTGNDTVAISKISLSVKDHNNHIVHQRFLDANGTAPSIQTIPNRSFDGASTELIFNPFTEFSTGMDLSRMEYVFTFTNKKNKAFDIKTVISPQKYQQKNRYAFPLKGRILVYDGHDLYAHHRRFNYEFAPIKGLGILSNFMRYAYDFVIVDSSGNQSGSDPEKPENYFGFANPVFAVAEGKVIYASNRHEDDKTFDIPAISRNALELYGNCIAIQHNDNNISIYGHLKKNSLKVKVGDVVSSNQEIAAIGLSGSSFLPHLHFEVRNSITHSAEGIPSYFTNVYLVETKTTSKLNSGLVETGNVIVTR